MENKVKELLHYIAKVAVLIYYEIKGCCSNMQFCQKRRGPV